MKYFMYGFSTQCLTVVMYHVVGKIWQGKGLANVLFLSIWEKRLVIEQISQKVIIAGTNLDGFQFGKLQTIRQIYQNFLLPNSPIIQPMMMLQFRYNQPLNPFLGSNLETQPCIFYVTGAATKQGLSQLIQLDHTCINLNHLFLRVLGF